MARKFKARSLSGSRLKQRASDSGSMFDQLIKGDYPTFSATEGAHRIRLLPGTFDEDAYWGYITFVHYQVGPDQGQYLCPERMNTGEACPICRERHQDGLDDETERQLRPTKRIAAWVIDRHAEKDGPKIWMMPQTVDKDIADRCIDKMTSEIIDIVDPEQGYDVEFTREGSSINTRYIGINIARRDSPITSDDEQLEKWLNFIEENPLSEVFNYYSAEHIERVFHGVPSGGKDQSPRHAGPRHGAEQAEPAPEPGSDVTYPSDEEEEGPPFDTDDGGTEAAGASDAGSLKERLAAKRAGRS